MTGSKTGLNPAAVLSMVGQGYYSERTAGARNVINTATEMVRDALATTPATDRIRLADYGAADGGTSRTMWSIVLTELRNNGDNRQVEMIYTDLASNDFSTLFRMMQGFDGDPADAYQKNLDGVFVHGCGTGFHDQLMADNSLNLGFSATAMHYVSSKPCELTSHVHMVGATLDEQSAFRQQAAQDLERILLARAAELVPGGRFICFNFGIDDDGRFLGNTGGVHMFNTFDKHWRGLRDKGRISAEEYTRATFTQHYRTMDEFLAPFNDPQSAVSQAGLVLKSSKSVLTPCPYRAAYDASLGAAEGGMSARDFAKTLIPTMRSWSETVFTTALDQRPKDEAMAIVDEFYQAYEDEVAANPDGHAMDYVHLVIDVEKSA
ncbi:MAG: SAM-dependent methyltransferase [Alphaproteobacteria bacterium]|nr:SAM-dependent methyltransferase [Alphaproteobacteria bacterium]